MAAANTPTVVVVVVVVAAAARLRPLTGLTGAFGPFWPCPSTSLPYLPLALSLSHSACAKIKINSPCLLHLRWVIAYTI